MVNLIIWLLYIAGITIIITQSSIFKPIRDDFNEINPAILGKLVSCPLCLGFWVGLFSPFLESPISHPFVSGVIGAIFSFLVFSVLWFLALKDTRI